MLASHSFISSVVLGEAGRALGATRQSFSVFLC